MSDKFKIVDCPRDAMQGRHDFIPTDDKIDHLQKLLKVGFEIIDCGSFVSPKLIPQMADTSEVLAGIDKSISNSKLSVIIGSQGGAERALKEEKVDYLGFPFSISEEFQRNNTNRSREEAFNTVREILEMMKSSDKKMILYFSMAFGNPYEEKWSVELVEEWANKFADLGIEKINLSDTIAAADPEDVALLFQKLIPKYPQIEFGAHFHSEYNNWFPVVDAAFKNGCRSFDGAIKGFGGCPMAKSDLVGNIPTEKLITYAESVNYDHGLNLFAFESAYNSALRILG